MRYVILAAGIGSRLGNPFPKCLTPIDGDQTILDHQLANLRRHKGETVVVVGFKKDLVMERHSDLLFAYNARYDQTGTAKSLLCALQHTDGEDVLWLNGDVIFDGRILGDVLRSKQSCMAVNTSRVGEEEIKYRTDARDFITEVSKNVKSAMGEAVGINCVKASDLKLFRRCLEEVGDRDYFEAALELAINRGLRLKAIDISRFSAIEVDFLEDLKRAKALFSGMRRKTQLGR